MSWPLVKLGEVAKLINGDRGKNYPSKGSFVDEGIPFINAGCLSNEHTLIEGALNYITEDKFDSLRSGKVEKGDILFCLRGSLGKFALVDTNMKGAIASSLVIIRANEKVHIDYLKHYLGSFLCQREIQAYENGAAQPNLSATDLKNFEIPFPPLVEQKRIAAILDKADAIRQKRKQAIELADKFLRSVFLDMFGDPVTNPKGWETSTLDKLVNGKFQNGAYFPKEQYSVKGVEMVHMSDAFYDYVPRGSMKRVMADYADLKKYNVNHKDLLISRRSLNYEGAAKPSLIEESEEPLLFESSLIRITPNSKLMNKLYLFAYLSNELVKEHKIRKYVTGATIKGISQKNLETVEILVPPMELQQSYADIFIKVEKLKSELNEILLSRDMFESLSQKAFSGQL